MQKEERMYDWIGEVWWRRLMEDIFYLPQVHLQILDKIPEYIQ